MAAKKHQRYESYETELEEAPEPEPVVGRKGGRGVSGKGLSDTRSSAGKGRKSSTSGKKIEKEAK